MQYLDKWYFNFDITLIHVLSFSSNNFLRIWVLRVCQQSEKHLDKILNVDEFVRRIYSVIHSNDPVGFVRWLNCSCKCWVLPPFNIESLCKMLGYFLSENRVSSSNLEKPGVNRIYRREKIPLENQIIYW